MNTKWAGLDLPPPTNNPFIPKKVMVVSNNRDTRKCIKLRKTARYFTSNLAPVTNTSLFYPQFICNTNI